MRIRLSRLIIVFVIAVAAATALSASTRPDPTWPEYFSARAINMGNIGVVLPGPVDLFIVGWSSRADARLLAGAYTARGSAALLTALRNMPELGHLRTPDGRVYFVNFAWSEPRADGGRRMVLMTSRALKYWDAAKPAWNRDDFTLIEIRLDREGRGDGKMSLTTRIAVSEELDLLELEDYANEPVRLTFAPIRLRAPEVMP